MRVACFVFRVAARNTQHVIRNTQHVSKTGAQNDQPTAAHPPPVPANASEEPITFHPLLCCRYEQQEPIGDVLNQAHDLLYFDIHASSYIKSPLGQDPWIGLKVTDTASGDEPSFIRYVNQWGLEPVQAFDFTSAPVSSWELPESKATFEIRAADIGLPPDTVLELQPVAQQCKPIECQDRQSWCGFTCEWWYSPHIYVVVLR